MLFSLLQIINLLISVITWLVIAQFVLSLLINFNVVNTHSDFVAGLWRGINALLDPVLRPVRRILPDTRPMDFSPLVVIVGLQVVGLLVEGAARSIAG